MPTGVALVVDIVRMLAQVGLHGSLVKLAVAPAGNPEALRLTGCEVPNDKFRVIVFDPDDPCVTGMLPLFDSV